MMNKKVISAVSIGTALGASGVIAGAVETQKTSAVNLENSFSDIISDSRLTNNLTYDELLLVPNDSLETLNKVIKKDSNQIIECLSKKSRNVEFELIENTARYENGICKVDFTAKPIDGHSWLNGSTSTLTFSIEIFNIEVDENVDVINKDAIASFEDKLSISIELDNLTDENFNEKVLMLNLSLKNYSNYLSKEYKNVKIEYIPDTACLEEKSIKVLITPIKDHYWENGTQVSYVSTILIDDISLKNNTASDSEVSNINIFNKEILLESKTEQMLNFVAVNIDWNNQSILNEFKNSIFKNVHLSYVLNSASINEDICIVALEATPIKNHSWKENGLTNTKKVFVQLNNVKVKSTNLENQVMDIEEQTTNEQLNVNLSKSTKINTTKKTFIPSSKKIQLWWNKEFENTSDVISKIFSDNNLWSAFKMIEDEYNGVEVLYWIKNSPKLLSWSEASIDVGVKPKNGYTWDDNGVYERKLNIVVEGFCIKA